MECVWAGDQRQVCVRTEHDRLGVWLDTIGFETRVSIQVMVYFVCVSVGKELVVRLY